MVSVGIENLGLFAKFTSYSMTAMNAMISGVAPFRGWQWRNTQIPKMAAMAGYRAIKPPERASVTHEWGGR
jgi:hypothetical protein